MRIPIAFGVATAFVFVFTIFQHNTSTQTHIRRQTLITYTPPGIPEDFKGQITYPLSSQDPSGNPAATDDGPGVYRSRHREGWNGCLWSFYIDRQYGGTPMWKIDRSNDIFWQPQPGHHNVATNDGWFACVDQLREQLRTKTEEELRGQLTSNLHSVRQSKLYFHFAIGASLGIISIGTALALRRRAEQVRL
jgi:hypothetical protein